MRSIEIISRWKIIPSMPRIRLPRAARILYRKPLKNNYNDKIFQRLKDYLECEYNGKLYYKERKKENVAVRRWMCYIMTDVWGKTLYSVADKLKTDHSTVIHHRDTIRNWIRLYPRIEEQKQKILFYT